MPMQPPVKESDSTIDTLIEKEPMASQKENDPLSDNTDSEMKAELERVSEQRRDALAVAKESQDQTQALLQALDLLSKLACLDNALYSSTLAGSGGSVGSNHLPAVDPDKDVSVLQQRLDDLQSKWKLEETPVPMLLRSIHRLQSNNSQLVGEADQQTLHVQSMEAYCAKHEQREKKLEKAIHKLHQQNRALREKLKSTKRERKSIVKNVQNYVSHVNLMKKKKEDLTIEEQRVANQLKAHERLLRLERLERAALDDGGGNRRRTLTSDSLVEEGVSNRSRLSTYDSMESFSGSDRDDVSSVVSSVSSVSTVSSLVIDEGVATIRYTPAVSPLRKSTNGSQEIKADEDAWSSMRAAFGCAKPEEKKPPAPYHLTFPAGVKVGLQFHKVPFEKEKLPVKKSVIPETSPVRRGLLTDALLHDTDAVEANNKKKAMETKTETKDVSVAAQPTRALSINFNFDSMLRRGSAKEEDGVQKVSGSNFKDEDGLQKLFKPGSKDEESTGDYAFLVCGFNGFDSKLNVRPTLGARLIAVDGHFLDEGKWTFAQVREAIQASGNKAASGDGPSTFTMSFRNEPLNKKQKEMLNKAVKAADEKMRNNSDSKTESKTEECPAPASALTDEKAANNSEGDTEPQKKGEPVDGGDAAEETASGTDVPVATESDGHESKNVQNNPGADKSAPATPPGAKFKKSFQDMGSKFKSLW